MPPYMILVNRDHPLNPYYIPPDLTEPNIPFYAPGNDPRRLLHPAAAIRIKFICGVFPAIVLMNGKKSCIRPHPAVPL